MNYGDHNFIEIAQQTKLRVAPVALACRARRVERVELVVSSRDVTSQVEFGLYSQRRVNYANTLATM